MFPFFYAKKLLTIYSYSIEFHIYNKKNRNLKKDSKGRFIKGS
jgi:hypothetical protein